MADGYAGLPAGPLAAYLGVRDANNAQSARNQQMELQSIGGLSQLQAMQQQQQALQREQAFRQGLQALGPNASQEALTSLASQFASPKDVLTTQQSSLDRKTAQANTKEVALARLAQTGELARQSFEAKARTAQTAEERNAITAQWNQFQARLQAEKLKYDTGANIVSDLPLSFPQQAPSSLPADIPAAHAGFMPTLQAANAPGAAPFSMTVNAQGQLVNPSEAQQMPVPAPSSQSVQQDNWDARDLRAGGPASLVDRTQSPAQSPVVPTAALSPAQPVVQAAKPVPTMPEFTGSPKDIAASRNRWLMEQAKAGFKGDLNLAGGRESQQNNRIMTGANEAVAVLKNIAELPISASTGIFGTRGHQTGIFNSGAETLVQKSTTQEVQDYRSVTAGLQRFLGAIETSGMSVPVAVMNSVDSVVAREGMTNLTKLRNMAEIRQIIEKGLEVVMTNPRVPPEQKALMQKALDEAKTAVPFTQGDITKLQRMQAIDKNITLSDLVKQLKPQDYPTAVNEKGEKMIYKDGKWQM